MRTQLKGLLLAAAVVAMPMAAQAGDREDVLRTTNELFAALKTGDQAALERMVPKEGFTEFPGRGKGRLLIHFTTAKVMAAIKGGLHSNVEFLHPDVVMTGPDSAFVTGYRYGQVYQGDTPTPAFTTRGTIIFQKVSGQWKVVHLHFSPLVPES